MIKIIQRELQLDSAPTLIAFPGAPEGGTSGVLIFNAGEEKPLAFVKIFRNKNDKRMSKEIRVLRILSDNCCGLAANSPEFLFSHRSKLSAFLCQKIVPGKPVILTQKAGCYCEKEFERILAIVTKFLISLGKLSQTLTLDPIPDVMVGNSFDFDSFDLKGVIQANTIIEHGDLVLHNLLIDGENLGVIDWSDARMSGAPLFDYFNFTLNMLFRLRESSHYSDFEKLFEFGFFEKNHFSFLIRDYAYLYLDSLGIDRRTAGALLGSFLESYYIRESIKISDAKLATGLEPSYLKKLNHRCKETQELNGIFGVLKEFLFHKKSDTVFKYD